MLTVRTLAIVVGVALLGLRAARAQEQPRAVGHVLEVEVEQTTTTTGRIVSMVDGHEEGLEDRVAETTRLVFLDRIDHVDAAGRPDARTRFVLDGTSTVRRSERVTSEDGAEETAKPDETKVLSVVGRHLTASREGEFFDHVVVGGAAEPLPVEFDPEALVGEPERWPAYGGPREGAPTPAEVLERSGAELLPGWPAQLVRGFVEELTGLVAAFGKPSLREVRWSVATAEASVTYRMRFAVAVVQDGEREESEIAVEMRVVLRPPSRELPPPPPAR